MNKQWVRFLQGITVFGCLTPISTTAQVIPDNTLPENSVVTSQDDVIQIDGGTIRGTNLFHSFSDFSIPTDVQASFNNGNNIDNILSRVTGGTESIIEGGISAQGTANVFLINPAGIIFGENAFLDVGGSFIGSTADSLLFPDGIEYSATNLDNPPILTINAPIGLGFRDSPGDIVNRSIVTDDLDTPDDFDDDDLIGLRVFEDRTFALIGGEIFIDGGFISTIGGRIELGSVAENSTVGITPVAKGFDFSYEAASGFQDITLSFAALVNNLDANTGDIDLQGNNISLIEGSAIGITTEFEGQAGNINIVAIESLTLDGDSGEFQTNIFSDIADDATGENSSININTPLLNINNGAFIATTNDFGNGDGVDINIDAAEINIIESFLDVDGNPIGSGIFSDALEEGTGNGGDIRIVTDNLTIEDGSQIATGTFGSGDSGNLTITASELIELIGTIADTNNPSAIFANVGIPENPIASAGNGGNITINTPRLTVTDGAQIATTAQGDGNGGTLTINASESVLLSGFTPLAEFRGEGVSGVFVSVEPSYEEVSTDFDTGEETLTGEIISTTGNGGTLNLTTNELIVEQGASISADTFSLGNSGNVNLDVNSLIVRGGGEVRAGSLIGAEPILDTERGAGGTLNINATESVEVSGNVDLNGELVNSSILTRAESNGDAGNLTLTTNNLNISNGGQIDASSLAEANGGNLSIAAQQLEISDGAEITAATAAGTGGNITLQIDDTIDLNNNSLISAAATGEANGGNITIDTNFIIARPNGNNDIIASAGALGTGGEIRINAENVLGLEVRPQSDRTNDLDATGGVDGQVIINTPDTDLTQGLIEISQNVIEADRTVAQVCRDNTSNSGQNSFVVRGKGGIPDLPTAPLNSETLLGVGDNASIKPIETSKGKIVLARGAIRTESGIVLTAYPTDNVDPRKVREQINCTDS